MIQGDFDILVASFAMLGIAVLVLYGAAAFRNYFEDPSEK